MARYIEQSGFSELETIVEKITGFKEWEENFDICVQFALSNLKYHRFLSVDSHKVTRSLQGICEKFKIHSDTKKAQKLEELSQEFLESPVFEQRQVGKTDTHYAILSFLLLIAESPVNSHYVETLKREPEAVEDDFDWGAYLLEGIDRYVPSDEDSSDWTDEEDTLEERDVEVPSLGDRQLVPSGVVIPSHVTTDYRSQSVDGSTFYGLEAGPYEGSDWLSRNLVAQYWRGEKLEIESGRYLSCQLNKDWDVYKQSMNPLSGQHKKTFVTENILMREVIWMLMGVSRLYLFQFNGRYFIPKHDIAVMHLSEESLVNLLGEFTRYGSYIQVLQNFVRECSHFDRNGGQEVSQTYQAFATCIAEFLQNLKQGLSLVEKKLIKQEEIVSLMTLSAELRPLLQKVMVVYTVYMKGVKQEEIVSLMTLSSELRPLLQKVMVVYTVYMKGVKQGETFELQSQKATLVLTTLYNTLMSCDTLFDIENSSEGGEDQPSAELVKLLLPMWIQTCQPYINIIDTWISCGYLTDPKKEFIIQRNKNIDILDGTFWEKSFAFHTMTEGKDDKNKDYSPVDWAPKFLQPVLQQIVLTGKSMEMLEGLGKLAESESGKSLDLVELKEGHLYEKFLTSLKSLLGTKSDSRSEESGQREATTTTETLFSPDIERQMRDKGMFDNFLQINFESLMTFNKESHTILEDKFCRLIESLDLENLQPVELILQECLYPHIQRQYERVCIKLVEILKTEYKLMDCLAAIKNFFLMEAGDAMYFFYTEIFDKIRLHEPWRDTTSVTWFLHEALEYHFPDEISRVSVVIETPDSQKDIQPINVTDCIRLQYQVPVPLDVIINTRCQEIFNQIFSFLLQVKRAKYCLDELRFYDLAKDSGAHHSDDLFSSISTEAVSRKEKIHRMHILKMRLTYFVNSLHNYIMTRILHSTGLEFIKELDTAADLDQIIEIHAAYVRKIHERCLLHRRNMFLKEAIMKVLNIILLFQSKWDQGIDLISLKQIEDTETEFSRCIQFLSSFLQSVIQRGSFPHLESLAFGLETLMPS